MLRMTIGASSISGTDSELTSRYVLSQAQGGSPLDRMTSPSWKSYTGSVEPVPRPAAARASPDRLYDAINSRDFRYFNQIQAVVAAVLAQMAAMTKNVSDTPTVSANVPANGAPTRALPRIPILYMAIMRPRTPSRALSCRVLVTVTLKKPQETPSKNMPASAK